MTNITKSIAFVASIVISGAALTVGANANTPTCPTFVEMSVNGEVVHLPADVAENVTVLQGYGDRYAGAVANIVAEYRRPDWSFGNTCGVSSDPTDAADS